jgi:hypothetical protein
MDDRRRRRRPKPKSSKKVAKDKEQQTKQEEKDEPIVEEPFKIVGGQHEFEEAVAREIAANEETVLGRVFDVHLQFIAVADDPSEVEGACGELIKGARSLGFIYQSGFQLQLNVDNLAPRPASELSNIAYQLGKTITEE